MHKYYTTSHYSHCRKNWKQPFIHKPSLRKMHVKNISEFKILLAQEVADDERKNIQKKKYKLPVDLTQNPPGIVKNILHFETEHFDLLQNTLAINRSWRRVSYCTKLSKYIFLALGRARWWDLTYRINYLALRKNVLVYGRGCSAHVCVLNGTKRHCILYSYSGKSASVCQSASIAREKKAQVIALCARRNSPLITRSDVHILTPFTDPQKHIGADVSRIHHLLVVDILCALMVAQNLNTNLQALENTRTLVKGKKKTL